MQEYSKVDDLLDELEELIKESKSGSIFGGKFLDKDEAFELLESIRYNLPLEFKDAKKVLESTEKIIQDAQHQATLIVKQAEEEAKSLVLTNEITLRARVSAEKSEEESRQFAREMHMRVMAYCDSCLEKAENVLQESLDEFGKILRDIEGSFSEEIKIIYENRQELRGSEF